MPSNKRIPKRALAFFLMFVAIVIYAVNLQLAKATFTVINRASEPVEVTASWQGQVNALGLLAQNTESSFEVEEEAVMKFRASYASGKISSALVPSYSLGSDIVVLINDSTIEIKGQ